MARILIVDDDPAMRRLMEIHLVEAGHSVTAAKDATEAINVLLRRDFDMVVTDFQMPWFDGIKLSQTIKNDPKTRHIPVVVLTGYEDESVVKAALNLNANFISKAEPIETIVLHIGRALARQAGLPPPRRD